MAKGAPFGFGTNPATPMPSAGKAASQEGTQVIADKAAAFSQNGLSDAVRKAAPGSKAAVHANALQQRVKGLAAAGIITDDFANAVKDRVRGVSPGQGGS